MFRTGELSYDLFARGAARLSARLARLDGGGDKEQQQEQNHATKSAAENSNNHHHRWRWVARAAPPLTGARAVGVLELERWLPARQAAAAASGVQEQEELEDDDAAVASNTQQQHHHRYLFHAAHSAVYRVPVLCFRAEAPDGAPLSPEQVRADLSPWLQMHGPPAEIEEDGRGKASSWEFYLARGEHPAEGGGGAWSSGAVFFLHPCRTAERMALLMAPEGSSTAGEENDEDEGASRYLAAWLSAVAPAVGLPRPPQREEGQAETTRRRQ